MPSPSRSSSRTGPTLTAAGRRFTRGGGSPPGPGESDRRTPLGTLATVRHIPDTERRARLARRHALAPGHRAADPEAATRAVTVLHSTEPATVYLSVRARVDGLTVADVDRALYADRTLVKQLAMRRTLFVFPRDLLPAAWGSASARVAGQLEARLVKEVEAAGHAADGAAWLEDARAAVVDALAGGAALTAQEIRERVPALEARLDLAPGKKYAANVSIAPRVLTQLGGRGRAGPRRERRPLAALQATVGADVRLARRRASGGQGGRGVRRAGRSLAALVRPRHRGRPRVVAGRDQGRRPGRARRARRGRGVAGRRRHRLGAARRRRPGGRRRAVGGAAAGARPDGDGLEASATSTSARTRRTCSTATATPARRPGGTAASSAAGCRTTRAWSRSARSRSSRRPPCDALEAEAARLTDWLDGVRVGTSTLRRPMKVVDWVQP